MKVAVIEKDPFLGGTCTHRGCIPTKALLENADIFEHVNRAKEFGVNVGGVQLDFKTGQDRKQKVVDTNAKGIEFLFKKNKVERITGFGKIAGKGVVEVSGNEPRSEEHTSELQSHVNIVCRLLLEKKNRCRSRTVVER